jgi:GT2 family glycosyltransferase
VDLSRDPNNEINLRFRIPRYGWTVLELALENAGPRSGVDVLFFSSNNQLREASVYLPIRPGRIARRACYLPVGVWGIRLTLRETSAKASAKHFRFHCVSPWSAHDYLSQRLVDLHHLYRDCEKVGVLKLIKGEAKKNGQHWRELALLHYGETFVRYSLKYDYHRWIVGCEKLRDSWNENEGERLRSFKVNLLISILLRPSICNHRSLEPCINAILGQSYSNWELILPDSVPCQKIAESDRRIRCNSSSTPADEIGGMNSAMDEATGEYFILLGEDGILAPNALLEVVGAINDKPGAMLLYSDEDKLDGEGNRFAPHFKPDWNPDLLLSQNYLSQLAVFKNELMVSLGRLRGDLDDIENYGLLLGCIAQLKDTEIVHIPKILYHQYENEKQATINQIAAWFTTEVGIRLLNHYFEQKGGGVTVEPGLLPQSFRARWPLPLPSPRVSLIIPTKNNFKVLKQCIRSILNKTDYDNYEILVLDNRSDCSETLGYLDSISEENRVSVHSWDHPFNYSAINNFGVEKAEGSILAFLNNDVEVINPEWLVEMVSHACREEIGCVGAKLYYPNDTVQHAGVILGIGGIAGHSHKYFKRDEPGYFSRLKLVQNLSAVTGACMVLRRSVFDEVGGLDENLAVAFNDVDFCLRVREAGYRNLWTPYAELYHHESLTRGLNDTGQKQKRIRREAEYMRNRWGKALDQDPAYNPNLTLIHEDFSLK